MCVILGAVLHFLDADAARMVAAGYARLMAPGSCLLISVASFDDALIVTYLDEIRAALAAVGAGLLDDAYLFSNDPAHARPWNPDWVTHQIAVAGDAAGVKLDIKGGRHYTASQLLAGGFDLRNTAARLGHSGGGATTLRHYAEPCPRGRPASRRLPRPADRQIYSAISKALTWPHGHGWA